MHSKPIPYGKQSISQEDIDAVVEVLRSDYLTQGPTIKKFEDSFASYVGSEYAIAVANGTAALHLNVLALGLKEGGKVITSPITFAASANCIRYAGGEVVFSDIDPQTYLLDLKKVEALIKESPKGTYAGIIPVDFAGRAVDLKELRRIADDYDMWIIEDSCHAPGGYFVDNEGKSQHCGNGSFADLSIFSFHPVKHIAAGEGGMITTNDKGLYDKLISLRTHGIVKDDSLYQNSKELAGGTDSYPMWYMEMQSLGYNYRISDIHAALGSSQLTKAETGLSRRRVLAKRYAKAFEGKDFVKGQSGCVEGHAYHLYILEVNDRLGLYNHLRAHKIYAQIHYIPCHLMPYYQSLGWSLGDLPHAENYYKHCISLPMFPSLSDDEQDFVISKIEEYYHG